MTFAYTPQIIANLESSHSPERLAPYFALAGSDKELGLRLYVWNSSISQALYTPLQALEVALRNGIGAELRAAYGAQWFELNPGPPLHYPLPDMLLKVQTQFGQRGIVADHGRIVAELNWGFWTGVLAKRYETSLWRPHLRSVFNSTVPLTRDKIFVPLDDLRRLRNRIAHHESILNRNIAADYAAIINLIEYICPTTAAWVDSHSQVMAVLASKP